MPGPPGLEDDPGGAEVITLLEVVQGVSDELGGAVVVAVVVAGAEVQGVVGCAVTQPQRLETWLRTLRAELPQFPRTQLTAAP